MDCYFFSYHWIQVEGKQLLRQGDGYYYSTTPNYNLDDVKYETKRTFSLHPFAAVSIQNVQPITKENFEEKTGRPFFG